MLSRNQVVTIRCPYSIVEQVKIFLCHLPGICSIALHHPNVIATTGVAGKGDVLSIRTKTRLNFKGQSTAQWFGFTARCRHDIDITQQVKRNLLPIRTYIKVHPRAFIRRKLNVLEAPDSMWIGNIPFLIVFLFSLFFLCSGNKQNTCE